MIKRRLLLHIGLPKCASTSIQNMLYDQGLQHYLGKPPHHIYQSECLTLSEGKSMVNTFMHPLLTELFRYQIPYVPSHLFDSSAWEQQLKIYLDTEAGLSESVILSDELLSGAGFFNYEFNKQPDPLLILKRFASLFADVKILMVCRAVHPFLESYYNQLLKQGFNLSFERFVQMSLKGEQSARFIFELSDYLIAARKRGFEITVIPLEAISQGLVHTELETFFQTSLNPISLHNRSQSERELLTKLNDNLQFPTGLGRKTGLDDVQSSRQHFRQQMKQGVLRLHALSPPTLERLEKCSKQSHQRLNNLIDWDLASLGYDL